MKLENATEALGRKIVGYVPGVWAVSMSLQDKKTRKFVLKVLCTKKAKTDVLNKYGAKFEGHRILFEIMEEGPVFA